MIGRFLLGAGLGALVGTGLLAFASVVSPLPQAGGGQGPVAPDAAAEAPLAAPEAEERTATAVERAPEEVSDPIPEAVAASESAGDPTAEAPLAAADAPAETAAAAADDAGPDAPPLVETGLLDANMGGAEFPPTPPSVAEAPLTATAPEGLAGLDGDALPLPADVPAAAPGLTAPDAPAALSAPAGDSADVAAPVSDLAAPASLGDPGQPGAPQSESAPVVGDMPELPPLTAEEEALLRQIAEEGPDSVLPPDGTPDSADADPALDSAESDPAPQVTVLDPAATPSTLPAAPALADSTEGVTTNRLPRIGAPSADAAEAAAAPGDDRPLAKFARSFDNPEGKPVFAIILIDDGSDGLDRASLADLPFPVSFALDPTRPNAAEHAAIYRAGGQEVLILAGSLFKGASASDVAVTLEAMAATLPETVAVMDTPEHAFQGDRPLASLVVPVIGGQGRGVVSWDQGLNAADQVARREDVPSASAFRDLDGAEEATPVIRRYLDRAAFKAAQEGRVTVVGRTRPETIAAIVEWTLEGRAATVALGPVSAVLSVE